MTLLARIARLKEIPFEDVLRAIGSDCGVEIPDTLPGWICCPIHGEKTPSLLIKIDFWYCHAGCKKGGDALDFLVALEDLPLGDAVTRIEALLGLSSDAAEAAAARSRAKVPRVSTERQRSAWRRSIESIVDLFFYRVRPALFSPDPVIFGIFEGPTDHVFEELKEIADAGPPIVPRVRRERLREFKRWALAIAEGCEKEAERATGRDRLDIALLSRGSNLTKVRAEKDSLRPLRDALQDLERRARKSSRA